MLQPDSCFGFLDFLARIGFLVFHGVFYTTFSIGYLRLASRRYLARELLKFNATAFQTPHSVDQSLLMLKRYFGVLCFLDAVSISQ